MDSGLKYPSGSSGALAALVTVFSIPGNDREQVPPSLFQGEENYSESW
jgi:hypothetical protein